MATIALLMKASACGALTCFGSRESSIEPTSLAWCPSWVASTSDRTSGSKDEDALKILEISNECDNKSYDQAILRPDRLSELLQLGKSAKRCGRRLLVDASFNGARIPRWSLPPTFCHCTTME